MAKAFVTGSYAYGTPTIKSDIDLVIFVSKQDVQLLKEYSIKHSKGKIEEATPYKGASTEVLRFAGLNLLCCTDMAIYETWVYGTKTLKRKAPVGREHACVVFHALRKKANAKKETT